MTNVSREYKNNVFCLLYRDRENLLSLYNAMNGTDYRDEEKLTVVTLEHTILLRMHNDAAFLIDSGLNLYEQQATVNPNIPLRDLYYVAEELKKMVPAGALYGKKAARIPALRFVVFYNGTEEQPAEKVLKLSDLYEIPAGSPDLELVVRQVNINSGYNDDILQKCESLRGYMIFVDKVRGRKAAGTAVEKAVEEAVDECIREGVLADFFKEHRSEVIEMGIFEFNQEDYERVIKAEGYEDGYDAGKAEGIAVGKAEDILELLSDLGPIPEELRTRILQEKRTDELTRWHKLAAKAESIEEFREKAKS